MASPQHPEYGLKGYLGRIFLTLGLVALMADLAVMAQPLVPLVEKVSEGLFGLVPAIGLSVLNAARVIALHELDYFSIISRILVLFISMVAVIVGFALLRPAAARPTQVDSLHAAKFRGRETDNG